MKKFFKKNETVETEQPSKSKKGFAMLFTVLVVSLMLAIGLGIADLTFKQTVLSSLARDSQAAFYQADSGVECGLYYTENGPGGGKFSSSLPAAPNNPTDPAAPGTLDCGNNRVDLIGDQSFTGYFVYQEETPNNRANSPCFSVIIDMVSDPNKTTIKSRGFSTCTNTARQVERGLSVTF